MTRILAIVHTEDYLSRRGRLVDACGMRRCILSTPALRDRSEPFAILPMLRSSAHPFGSA